MARTFIRQVAQISSSETFTDDLPMGSGLASQQSLEGDLNALRTMVRAAVGSAAWYTAPVESLSSLKSRVDAAALDIADLEAALAAEIARAESAEGVLQANIDAEGVARDAADVILQSNIDAEKAKRISADNTLQSNINAEAQARTGADNALNASILQEVSDRGAAVAAEQLAREAADALLSQDISDEVAAREAAMAQEVIDRDAAIALEAFAREAADQTLTDALAAEVVNRTNADSDLANDIAQEVSDRGAAILTEKTERQAGDLALAGLINTEIGNRQAADTTLQAHIDAEALARGNADSALSGRLDTAEADLVDLHDNKLNRDGTQAMLGLLDMGGFGIANLGTPVNSTDATTKAYVDALVTGLKLHEPVLARMDIVNGQFTGAVADGVQLVTGSRVFVVDSQNATNSGIYVAMISGPNATFARAADFAAGAEVDGAFFFCQQGDTYADTSWVQTSSNPVGQGPLSFSMMFSPGDYSAGAGLDLSAEKVFSVEPEGIVNSMLASASVSEGKIADLAVSESKLASLSVSTGKIADLAVTEAKLATSSVATSKIAPLAVTEAKIAAAAVATAKIADLAVTTAKVADAAITQAKLSLVAPVANLDAATKLYVDERGFGTKVRLVVEGGLYATLQAAVDAAVANDVILVGPKASGDWGNVSFPTDKRLMVSALGGMQEQKVIKIGTVTFDTSGGAGNVNNNEVYLSGLHITGTFSTQAVLFQGTAPARLRMSNCYVYNLGSGDGIVNNNNAANSSLYLDSVLAQSSSTTGTVLKHTKGYTFVKNRSMFEGGLYAASCAAGNVEVYDSSFSMSGAREAVLVSGTGLMTLGYSTIQNTNTSASAIGVNISSATASFGAGDATISVGAYGVTPAGKAVSGSGYYSFGNVTYGFSSSIGASVVQVAAARTGGTFTTALSMSSNKITSLATPTVGTDAANKQYVDDQAALKLSLSGGTMSGALAMGGKAITNLLNPVNAQDAATKKYVDDSITGLDSRVTKVFAEVLVDVTANTALVGGPNGNLSAVLPSMPADGTAFASNLDIYLNGQLLRAGVGNDVVRDSITATALLLSFPAAQGDILCVIQYS
jgi:hypothetical protein